jgi:hypothetical protein
VFTASPLVLLMILAEEPYQYALVGGWLLLAIGSFCWGHRLPGGWRATLLLGAAALLWVALPLATISRWEVLAAALGGCSLAAGHWLHLRLCRSCGVCTERAPQT